MRRDYGVVVRKKNYTGETNSVLITEELVKFEYKDMHKYIKKFDKLKEQRVIKNCKFEDYQWELAEYFDEENIIERSYVNFKFSKTVNKIIKCYIVFKLHDDLVKTTTIKVAVKSIMEAIDLTEYFSWEKLHEYYELIDNCERGVGIAKARALLEFLMFYPLCKYSEMYSYLKIISNKSYRSNVRNIPNYSSIILFDYILQDFIDSCSSKDRERYFPILLWWRITKIIPMRSREFTLIKVGDFISNVEEEKYYLKITRIKEKKKLSTNNEQVKPLDKIRINREIVDLIVEYNSIVSFDKDRRYLLSYESIKKFMEPSKRKATDYLKKNKGYVDPSTLQKLLDRFYYEIVKGKYGYYVYKRDIRESEDNINSNDSNSIQILRLGDTRHYAFCSMMLQGLNPLTIAQIGGHTKLESQIHYHSHLDAFVDSNTYIMARRIKSRKNKYDIYSSVNPREKLVTLKDISCSNVRNYISGEDGYCTSDNVPFDCSSENCNECGYFEDNSNNKASIKKRLKELDLKLKREIRAQIDFIKNNTLEMNVNYYNESIDVNFQEDIGTASNKLSNLIGKKAIVESRVLKLMEVDPVDK